MKATLLLKQKPERLLFLLTLAFSLQAFPQALKIMPLGNSITFDTYSGDSRPDGDKIGYRYQLYQSLTTAGYSFDFVGSESTGGNYLPTTPPDYSNHAGFPGYTAAEILSLLQTGRNRDGVCEIGTCDGSYLEYFSPDIMFIHLGTNGLNTDTDAENIRDIMAQILDEIDNYEATSGKTVPVYLCRIINRGGPNPNGNHSATSYYNDLLDNLEASRTSDSIIMVDMENGAGIDYRYTPTGDMLDYLHPAQSGYNKMGDTWFTAIEATNLAVPVVSDIPNQSLAEGSTFTVNLNIYVSDPQDPDADMTWSYSGNSNLSVIINSTTKIATLSPLNINWNGSETITFRATDPYLAYDEDAATFTLTAVNDAPTDISLAPSSVAEGVPASSYVGTFSTTDVDAGSTFTYSLVSGSGSDNNGSFNIVGGNNLVTTTTFNYETKSSYTIRVRSTDNGGLWIEKQFTITITNVNETPTDITLSSTSVAEHQAAGALVGNLSTTDPDVGNSHSYSLVSGTGSNDNSSFSIINNELRTAAIFDYETKSSYSVRIRSTDQGSLYYEKAFTITVTFTNQAPTNITLSNASVAENQSVNTVVGTFSTTDPNAADSHTYSLVSGAGSADNGSFNILTNLLRTSATFDYETQSTYSIRVRSTDAGSLNFEKQFTITVTNVNDAPVLANIEPAALSYTEGSGAVPISGTITATDVDNVTLQSATITISSGYQSSEDLLSFVNADGITGNWVLATGVLTLSGSSSVANYQTALRNVRYSNSSSNPNTTTRIITFRVNDGTASSNTQQRSIIIGTSNNPPVLNNIETTALSYTENEAAKDITDDITILDEDDTSLEGATIAITTNYQNGQDVLSFTNTASITGIWNAGNGTMTLTGTALLSSYRTALRNVSYQNTSENPSVLTRTVTFTVNDGDALSNTVTRNISITAINDAPVLSAIETAALAYTENMAAIPVSTTLSVADSDNTNLVSATVAVTVNFQTTQDVLAFNNNYGISGSWNPTSGVLTLTGNTTLANYQAALRSLTYQNTSDNPSVLTRTVSFIVNDGTASSLAITRNIAITAVNDAPVLSAIETLPLSYSEGDGAVQITNTLAAADADNTSLQSATIVISSGYQPTEDVLSFVNANGITGSWSAGTLTLTGASLTANYQAALWSVRYQNISENPSLTTRTIAFSVYDGTANSNIQSRNITLGAVNNPPVLSNIETTALPYTENQVTIADITGTVVITDGDDINMEAATISITANYGLGEDILAFTNANGITGTWNSASGVMTLSGTSTTLNYRNALRNVSYRNTSENPSVLSRTVSFAVSDGDAFSLPATRNIAITAVNDAPILRNIESIPLPYTTGQGDTAITATIAVADTDNVNMVSAEIRITENYRSFQDRLRYTSIHGITGVWENSSGTLTLSGTTTKDNYEAALRSVRYENISLNPNTRARTIRFRVTDGSGLISNDQTRIVSFVPSAVISGGGSICGSSSKDTVVVDLTGEPNWTILIRRTGGPLPKDTSISGIVISPHTFLTNVAGTYTLLKVSDQNYSEGIVSGTATVIVYPAATARLTGTSQICQDGTSTAPMTVDFTGTSPWTFTLKRNADDTTFTGVTQDPFNFDVSQQGIYKIISLYDLHCTGDTVAGFGTATVSYITSPKATLSGVDTTCTGDTATLNVVLTGTAPWSITYLRNGANAKTVNNITQPNYLLKVVGDGAYTISAVSDQVRSGCTSGTGTVVHYALPTATLSGTSIICEHTTASLRVTLTGTAPWTFSYHRGAETPTVVPGVAVSPRFITVEKAGTYTLVNVSDKNCKGTVSGNAVITITPAPVVSITGLSAAYSLQTNWVPIFGNPENGNFTGPALIEVRDTTFFFPSIAGKGIHEIIYAYRDPASTCYGYDTTQVAVLDADAEITFPDDDTRKFFCYNDLPFTIVANNTANTTGTFRISGGKGLVDNLNNTATIYPSQLTGGIYQVTYRYFNGTFLEVKENFEVEWVPDIYFIGFDKTSFCDNENPAQLNGNVTEGVFSGKAVYGNVSSGYFFAPKLSAPGIDTVFYRLTTARGCSRQIYKSLTIKDAADIDFTVSDTCVAPGLSDSTSFINLTASVNPVATWEWNFDDVSSGENNTSTLENPKHRYTRASRRDVRLTAITSDNCSSTREIRFNFGDKPTADFSWATECYHEGQVLKFLDKSAFPSGEGVITDYKWKFFDGSGYDSVISRNAEYLYDAPGNYEVELFVRTNIGCTDTLRKTVPLKQTFKLQEETYYETFADGEAGWVSGKLSTSAVNSWNLGEPTAGFIGSASYPNAWFTNLPAVPPKEQSWVTSPCYDFTGTQKPMIRFNLWRLFNSNIPRDGAVLQYTADSGKTWVNVGGLDDGINWYNKYDISGSPAGQNIGWAVTRDNGWGEARHSIDELRNKTDVQFRMAYGSDGTARNNYGIAFDNVWIGERSKMVLLEHFTNASDVASKSADSALNALANTYPVDIVDIQYHTSFPGTDPFYYQNPLDPGTRVLYYGLSNVPLSILDGGSKTGFRFNYDDKQLDENLIKVQSLVDPKFQIRLITDIQGSSLSIDAELTALEPVINRQVTLHIAVVERIITGVTGANGQTEFESVLKTMLPDAAGTTYTHKWNKGDYETLTHNWNLKNTYNTEEIRVVAFVQDELTGEIYQAMINKTDPWTSIDDQEIVYKPGTLGFIVYPNPVYNIVYLRFDEAPDKKVTVDLFDNTGKLVKTEDLYPGNRLFEMEMESFPEGFYFMRITSDNQFVGLQKLILSR